MQNVTECMVYGLMWLRKKVIFSGNTIEHITGITTLLPVEYLLMDEWT